VELQILEKLCDQAASELSVHDLHWPEYFTEVIQMAGFRLVPRNPHELKPLRLTRLIAEIDPNQTRFNYVNALQMKMFEVNYELVGTEFDGSRDWELGPGKVFEKGHELDAKLMRDFGTDAIRLLCGLPEDFEFPTGQARRVCLEILPGVISLFLQKNVDYDENAQTLGYKGQFADIHRKYTKLYRGWWLGLPLRSEPAAEVAQDMIAHLLLGLLFDADEQADPNLDY
jgi:hypothetical protein